MNALKTYYRVKREEADKAFQEELKREKEEFELMSDDEKEVYFSSEDLKITRCSLVDKKSTNY